MFWYWLSSVGLSVVSWSILHFQLWWSQNQSSLKSKIAIKLCSQIIYKWKWEICYTIGYFDRGDDGMKSCYNAFLRYNVCYKFHLNIYSQWIHVTIRWCMWITSCFQLWRKWCKPHGFSLNFTIRCGTSCNSSFCSLLAFCCSSCNGSTANSDSDACSWVKIHCFRI